MEKKKIIASLDGNEAAAYGSYAFSEVAAIYPITPSSTMAEHVDAWASKGKENVFRNIVKVVEMQSEAGASGAIHGALQAGALATTYTASQGLLLMIPNLYKMVGEFLPGVLHVSARAIAGRALSIFGDHQDIYATRQTGVAMLCSHSVQEAADLAPVAHLSAIKARSPFIHFFDGFRTSHEIQKVELQDYDVLRELLDKGAVETFRKNALNPHTNPIARGGAENDDIYFQGREAQNKHFDDIVETTAYYLKKISEVTGREYAPFTYYGAKDATKVIIAMGSVTETVKETIDALNKKGEKVGLVKVHLYRPFSCKYLLNVLPKTVKRIAVLDRTKESGATGEPLYLDVVAALAQSNVKVDVIVGGRYGLSSKDTQPNQIKAVYDNLDKETPLNSFTIGINDDVTNLSLTVDPKFHIDGDYTSCLFYGLGSDGTVSANKNSIKIIGDNTNKYIQAYFAYDSKKSGGTTRSHLRFGDSPIRSTYYVKNADFISCSLDSYIVKYDMLSNLKEGGTFLLNTEFTKEELLKHLPNRFKKQLAQKKAKFYIIDATEIAKSIGMGRRTNTILQSAFFKLNPQLLDYKKAKELMKEMAKKSYSKKGEDVVKANYLAIDKGDQLVEVEVNPNWTKLTSKDTRELTGDDYYDKFVYPITHLDGYDLPVSAFTTETLIDGSMESNVAFKEKRNIAEEVPVWHSDKCIQCNKCAFVCPHATIRTFVLDDKEVEAAPGVVKKDVLDAMGGPNVKGLKYRVQVSPLNCVGCGLCVKECPGIKGEKALTMESVKDQVEQEAGADYLYNGDFYKKGLFPESTVKGAGLLKPYFEVSGACAGCGETPYYRLISQLFGEDMLIANATGCSSIYSGSTPSTPFVKDSKGQGPAWANSLFEDNAEYGFGMSVASSYKQYQIVNIINKNLPYLEKPLQDVLKEYLANLGNRAKEKELAPKIVEMVKKTPNAYVKELLEFERDLVSKSQWIVGGDGWAYDIGYGGLDHVLANNENVNILVLDTEVYSNTGGQSSKSSQTGSIAKFTAAGKKTAKKDLAAIAMAYGHVYVAQINMGANNMQAIKALKEAESYDGPSLIIAYSPCIEHGIKGGLMNHQETQKAATESGYFNLFRYDPRLEEQGKNPLQLDFKEPDFDKFKNFLLSETRYNRLPFANPEEAEALLEASKKYAMKRFERLKKMGEE